MFELDGKRYSNEQEVIDAGVQVIYWYCINVKGRWIDIEQIVIEDEVCGYLYALEVIRCRYEPELETVYLMRNSCSYYVNLYTRNLVRYGNV